MRILLVIHGYPMRYNAGSEVYTQSLAHALAQKHTVGVFTRQENAFLPEYVTCQEYDQLSARIPLFVINTARGKDRYRFDAVDRYFHQVLLSFKPDIVHIGHLNHLSTSLVYEAAHQKIPIIFTLHDYWLMCPRGQFIQMYPEKPEEVWALCDGQEDRKCAKRCYARYFSGATDEEEDLRYWTNWVNRRMVHIRDVCSHVNTFIAPSQYLLRRFRDEFSLPAEKLVHLDYGFHLDRLQAKRRWSNDTIVFGYIGTHIPAKGVNLVIRAIGHIQGKAILRIWGRSRGHLTQGLQDLIASLPPEKQSSIEWMGEYANQEIVSNVFNHCDVIVVPSIWAENSPLVIHEALQARVPVITADYGGMSELIAHRVNGLLFDHRNYLSLSEQMQCLVDNPTLANDLGQRGYLQSKDGNVQSIQEHVVRMEEIYHHAISEQSRL